jgi:predicted ATP-grasp superfamily ATP-dependent carboligase
VSPQRALPPAVLLDANDGCLAIARALARRGVQVHVLTRPLLRWVGRTRAATSSATLPQLPAGLEQWRGALRRFEEAVVLSGSDIATEFLACERPGLPPGLRCYEAPDSAHLALMNKRSLYAAGREAGVRVPWTQVISSLPALEQAAARLAPPYVIKASWGHRSKATTGLATRIVRDTDELLAVARPAVRAGLELLLTEYVPGGDEALQGQVTVRSADGSYPLTYGRVKLRQWPPRAGVGACMITRDVPEAERSARTLLDHANFVGVSSYECKRHAETGEVVLIEINVRVPQSFGLGESAGADASWRLYADLAGLDLGPAPPARLGRTMSIPYLDRKAVRRELRRRPGSLPRIVGQYARLREFNILDPRDPGPGVAWVRQSLDARARARRPDRRG